jgi:transposase
MLGHEDRQGDFFDEYVYEGLVPEEHLLLKIRRAVDFKFLEEETKGLYSQDRGRPSFPPTVLFRMLVIGYMYNLSDIELSRQCRYNLLYRVFVGLGIKEPTPDDTTLVVFRKRLGEEGFKRLFDRLVGICQEKGLIEGKLKLVDATALAVRQDKGRGLCISLTPLHVVYVTGSRGVDH